MRSLALLLFVAPLFAQQPDSARAEKHGPPEPKNLKLLQPGPDLMKTMMFFQTSLGVRCNHCHVSGNFASDEKPTKEKARHMIAMEREINAKFPDVEGHVSCYTCHRGAVEPLTAPRAKTPETPPAK